MSGRLVPSGSISSDPQEALGWPEQEVPSPRATCGIITELALSFSPLTPEVILPSTH